MKNLILILNLAFAVLCLGCGQLESQDTAGASSLTSLESLNSAFQWSVGSWGACSATACGTSGVQSRSVACMKNDNTVADDSKCKSTPKPSSSQTCSAMACATTTTVTLPPAKTTTVAPTTTTSAPTTTMTLPPATTTTLAPTGYVPPVRSVGATLLNVRDYGALGNATHDDTSAIQATINALPSTGGTVIVPDGTYMIDAVKSLKFRSNMHFKMSANAVLKEIANSIDNSRMINLDVVHDVEISGGKMIGDRDIHNGTTGESGHGISMHGGVRVTIRNLQVSKFWGDGLYIGAYQQKPVLYSNDVVVYQVVATQNRRQGLSITNAENIKVYDSEFSYTEGTPPAYGIDIEPNQITTADNNSRYARNIEIANCRIHHNTGGGVQFFRQVYNTTIRNNEISYNKYGLYSLESFITNIEGNLFAHNNYKGISFHTESDNMTVSGNKFRNNSTVQYGFTNDTNSFTTVTGQSSLTTPHIGVMDGSGVINILTNQYAK